MYWKATNDKGERYSHYKREYVYEWYGNHDGNAIYGYDGLDENLRTKFYTIVDRKGFDVRNIRDDETLINTSYSMRKAIEKYDKNNTKQIKMKLNINTDKDIIDYLSSLDNVQGKLKELIRQEIKINSKVLDNINK